MNRKMIAVSIAMLVSTNVWAEDSAPAQGKNEVAIDLGLFAF